jgi:hypothetical protein
MGEKVDVSLYGMLVDPEEFLLKQGRVSRTKEDADGVE